MSLAAGHQLQCHNYTVCFCTNALSALSCTLYAHAIYSRLELAPVMPAVILLRGFKLGTAHYERWCCSSGILFLLEAIKPTPAILQKNKTKNQEQHFTVLTRETPSSYFISLYNKIMHCAAVMFKKFTFPKMSFFFSFFFRCVLIARYCLLKFRKGQIKDSLVSSRMLHAAIWLQYDCNLKVLTLSSEEPFPPCLKSIQMWNVQMPACALGRDSLLPLLRPAHLWLALLKETGAEVMSAQKLLLHILFTPRPLLHW